MGLPYWKASFYPLSESHLGTVSATQLGPKPYFISLPVFSTLTFVQACIKGTLIIVQSSEYPIQINYYLVSIQVLFESLIF